MALPVPPHGTISTVFGGFSVPPRGHHLELCHLSLRAASWPLVFLSPPHAPVGQPTPGGQLLKFVKVWRPNPNRCQVAGAFLGTGQTTDGGQQQGARRLP